MLHQKLFHPIVHQFMIKTCIINRSYLTLYLLFFRKHWHTQWKFEVDLGIIVVINCQLSAWSVQLSTQKINAWMAQGNYNGTKTYMKSHSNFWILWILDWIAFFLRSWFDFLAVVFQSTCKFTIKNGWLNNLCFGCLRFFLPDLAFFRIFEFLLLAI